MTYYYAIYYDDYSGITKKGSSQTLQNAIKGLRKAMKDSSSITGYIFDSAKIPDFYTRTPKNLIGSMHEMMGKKKKVKVYGREITVFDNEYVWIPKGMRKEYKVLSDGRLIPNKK